MRAVTTLFLAVAACSFQPREPGQPSDAPPTRDASLPHDAPRPDALAIDAAASNVALVQQAQSDALSGTSLTAKFATPPRAGDVILMIGGQSNGNQTAVSGVGSGWARGAGSFANANVEIWYAIATGSGTTVTLTSTDPPSLIFMAISDWTGLSASDPLDAATPPPKVNAAGDADTAASAGSVTTTGTDLLVFAVSSKSDATFGPPATFAEIAPIESSLVVVEGFYEVLPSGAFDPTVVSPGVWDAALAAFRGK